MRFVVRLSLAQNISLEFEQQRIYLHLEYRDVNDTNEQFSLKKI